MRTMDRDYVRINHSTLETELTAEDRRRAVLRVVSGATDAADCAMLLDALGLSAEEGRTAPPRQDLAPSRREAS